jgi:hypothetical protein
VVRVDLVGLEDLLEEAAELGALDHLGFRRMLSFWK